MSLRRAAPGPQLGRGRVRVDAAKAIAKLREYQLADKTAWVLEAIRAAVASGATRVELRGDANDVWLSWDGPAWPAEDVPRLFDELVSPEATAERHHLRLLASGINSALGTNPAFIDVFAIAPTGGAVRTRFVPDMLDEPGPEGGASSLRELIAEDVAAPPGVAPGMLVHLRRRASLSLLSFLWEREPPELPLARAACEDLPVPLHLGRDVYARDRPRRDVLRAPFDLGGGAVGHLALFDGPAQDFAPRVEVAERGVSLSWYELPDATRRGPSRVPVPLRLFVDAPRMPTNASRSQVRREQHPIAAAEARAPGLLLELAELAAARMKDGGDERLRGAIISLLAASIAGPGWRSSAQGLTGPMRKLAKLPLLRTATGGRRSLLDTWSASIHTGKDPFPEELERWLGDVLWVPPGDASALLVVGSVIDSSAMRRIASWARAQRRADRAFFAHAPRAAVVAQSHRARMCAALGTRLAESIVPASVFDGMTGEVAVFANRTDGELIVLFHGRELERCTFESPIGFSAVIDTQRLVPAERYRGVVKDAAYALVERAMRAGVLCLVEAIAQEMLHRALPDGFASTGGTEHDARLVRDGLGIALELRQPIRTPPLTEVPLWPTADGSTATITQIARQTAVGLVAPDVELAPPAGRLTIVADARERSRLAAAFATVRFVHYDVAHTRRASALELARTLASNGRAALAVVDGRLVGAIALSAVRNLVVHHMAVPLAERTYAGSIASCQIRVDSEDVVPSADWTSLDDDAGLGRRDFSSWEALLLRAGALALVGERMPELVGGEVIGVDSELGLAVIAALGGRDPEELFGDVLIARLRAAPLAYLLGATEPCSIDELDLTFPEGGDLVYVDREAAPLEDFVALAGGRTFAQAAARLLGRVARNATDELIACRRAAARSGRHEAHLGKPVRALALDGPSVAITLDEVDLLGRGVVGLGNGGIEVDVLVEQRLFTRFVGASDTKLRAIVDIDPGHVGDDFGSLQTGVLDRIVSVAQRAALRVVEAHVAGEPHLLADPGPVRELAVRAARHVARAQIPPALRTAEAFPTLQGQRISIERAIVGRGNVAVASWHGAYLAPLPGAPAHPCDAAVLRLPDGDELRILIEALSGAGIEDRTTEVERLQNRRSMERGLLPSPTVPIAPQLKLALRELGPDGEQLGPGEIGLSDEGQAQLIVHAQGRVVRTAALAVRPPVKLAIDEKQLPAVDPFDLVAAQLRALTLLGDEPVSLDARVQQLAVQLVRRLAARPDVIPPPVRARLRDALLAGYLAPADAGDHLMFETLVGAWVAWRTLEAQVARHGSLWTVPSTEGLPAPSDPERLVIVLDRGERARLEERGLAAIDATHELKVEALARRNRERPLATQLDLGSREGVLAEAMLDEHGGRRGKIAVLAPSAAMRRGLHAHRAMFPFDVATDPCRWPTLVVVDDPRLTPDRTWSHAAPDDAWQELVVAIRGASEHLVSRLVEAPQGRLATYAVAPHSITRLVPGAPETAVIAGMLWLAGDPYAPHEVRVVHGHGVTTHTPAHGAAIDGALFAYTPAGWDLSDVVEKLCAAVHGDLVRSLLRSSGGLAQTSELVAAHTVHALALKRLLPAEARNIRPRCIAPLDATAFFHAVGQHQVRVRPAASAAPAREATEPTIVDDGGTVARTMIRALAGRIRRDGPAPVVVSPTFTAKPVEPTAPPHPIKPIVSRLELRLAQLGAAPYVVRIVDRDEPMMRVGDDKLLELAGDNARLAAVANACTAASPWAASCIDALAAHALTVLDVALTSMTEAAQLHAIGALLLES